MLREDPSLLLYRREVWSSIVGLSGVRTRCTGTAYAPDHCVGFAQSDSWAPTSAKLGQAWRVLDHMVESVIEMGCQESARTGDQQGPGQGVSLAAVAQ